MIRVKFRFGTANRKEMSWMSETSVLMDTLRQEGVSPDLLRAVEEYRTAHPLAEETRFIATMHYGYACCRELTEALT